MLHTLSTVAAAAPQPDLALAALEHILDADDWLDGAIRHGIQRGAAQRPRHSPILRPDERTQALSG